ncbi:MAG: sigma 54-interacting transcriptional regulator [Desulfitobacterium hafniense]|nr:sigma 54-interacting transcriptional regulator [Desulfitobacterium hafniense]
MGIITIKSDLCKACYSCVRNCPVKAIKVEDGKARVVDERCICCGSCLKVCSQNAKVVERHTEEVKKLLKIGKTVALIAPSIPASFPGITAKDIRTILKQLGFYAVHEATIGVEATLPVYQDALSKNSGTIISSYCPAIVSLITKYYPDLVPMLAPIDSAVLASAKVLAKRYPGYEIVFIGPCIAKKEEVKKYGRDLIKAVLSFKDLKDLLNQFDLKVEPREKLEEDFKYLPQEFPVSGGFSENLKGDKENILIVDGASNCIEVLNSLRKSSDPPRLLDILFCKGCLDGPELDSELSHFARTRAIREYSRGKARDELAEIAFPTLSFTRTFVADQVKTQNPSENDLREILRFTYKNSPSDELNCGACGYATCREKAVAVFNGLADVDMCLPYLIHKYRGETSFYKNKLETLMGKNKRYIVIIGEHRTTQDIKKMVDRCSTNSLNVILQGESGVGKRHTALAIHSSSMRRTRAFLEVDCSVTEEKLEQELFGHTDGAYSTSNKGSRYTGKLDLARGGVIYLKNLDKMPKNIQTRLVQLLVEKKYFSNASKAFNRLDVRFIGSTSVDLRLLVSEKGFRADLFYMLNVINIVIPPLRDKTSDIPLLVRYFLDKLNLEKEIGLKIFTEEALHVLKGYHWPGNIRELWNLVERSVYITDEESIAPKHLPPGIREFYFSNSMDVPNLEKEVAKLEKDLILKALKATGNNRAAAAKLLGLPRATLYLKIKCYEI